MPRAQREQQMLDAAVRVFSRSGYHSASMDEIAEECAVSKPLLYLYLGSKEALFAACLRREADRLIDALARAVDPSLAPGEQLYRGLEAFFAFVTDHRESWVVLYQQAGAAGGPVAAEVANVRRMVIDAVAELVRQSGEALAVPGEEAPGAAFPAPRREGGGGGEALPIAHALVGAADALADWLLQSGVAESPEGTARRLMTLVWIGMDRRLQGERFAPPGAD